MSRAWLAFLAAVIGVAAACASNPAPVTAPPSDATKAAIADASTDASDPDHAPAAITEPLAEDDLMRELESAARRIDDVHWECATEADARWLKQDLADIYADRDELTLRRRNIATLRKTDTRGDATRTAETDLARFEVSARRRLKRTDSRLEIVKECVRDQ
jgi:hypothetical protein